MPKQSWELANGVLRHPLGGWARAIALAAGFFGLLVGSLAMLGWVAGIDRLKDWDADGINMKFNAALATAVTGVGLLLACFAPRAIIARRVLGACLALIGGLTLLEHLVSFNIGLDTLFMDEPPAARATASPGRMGPPASTSFLLLGSCLILHTYGPRARRVAAAIPLAVGAIALLGLCGYAFGADMLYSVPRATGIAMQTAAALFVLSIGAGAVVAEHGLGELLSRRDPGGAVMRRLFLPMVLAMVIIGWARVVGQERGYFDTAFGSAIAVLLMIAVVLAVLWWCAQGISRTASALQENESRFRQLVENAPFGMYIVDADFRIAHVNADSLNGAFRNVRPVLGRDFAEAIRIIWPPDVAEQIISTFRHTLETGQPYRSQDFVSPRSDIEAVEGYEWQLQRILLPGAGGTQRYGVICYYYDSTQLRLTERALRESEARLRQATEVGKIGVWEWNIETGQVTCTDSLYAMHGLKAEEFGGTVADFEALVHPDDRAAVRAAVESALAGGSSLETTFRSVRSDGSVIHLFTSARVLRADGKPVRMHGATADVSAIQAGHEASELLSAIVNSSDDAIVSKSLEGIVLSWNKGAERLFGYTSQEIVGKSIEMLIPPELRGEETAILGRLRRGERIAHYETVRVTRDGRRLHISLSVSPLRDSSGRIVGAAKVARDITGQKRIQEELRRHREQLQQLVDERTAELEESHQRLRQSERLASIGTLSAGLGHDMGNLLVPLRIRLDALESMDLPPQAIEELKGIRSAADYLRRLATGLRMLAVDPSARGPVEPTELGPWWAETEPVYRNVLPPGVTLTADLGGCEAGWVAMSKSALTQAVFNLVQNAGDAMRSRALGMVKVSVRLEVGHFHISVSDNGPGMSDEVKLRCMEPFFSTKSRGLGTGLGLALVFGLTREVGGSVKLETSLSSGTSFTLVLPAAAAPEACGTGRRAFVRIGDARIRGYVASELRRMAFEVRFDQAVAADIDLVVVDELTADRPSGRVVAVGGSRRASEVRQLLRAAAETAV